VDRLACCGIELVLVHCVVTGGGLSLDHARWVATSRKFLFPLPVMAQLFRGKMLCALREAAGARWLAEADYRARMRIRACACATTCAARAHGCAACTCVTRICVACTCVTRTCGFGRGGACIRTSGARAVHSARSDHRA
jgi:hypothetical protein